ncbi:MAG TPA: hypothetical protein VGS78_15470 [Candidatus Sulfotelmatobacter sp.]|nr:hypothetical protein [Candidatus Sulfotelmatobacter sp.]
MQFAKDSFLLALQERLAALNPARTVTLNGATMPAVVVVENLPPSFAAPQPNTFYVEWGAADVVSGGGGTGTLMSLDVTISYYTMGSVQSMVDRGRLLAQLDSELLSICQATSTEKRDYTQSPSADLGTSVFWNQPSFNEGKGAGRFGGRVSFPERVRSGVTEDAESHQDARVERKARMTLYFFSEVAAI